MKEEFRQHEFVEKQSLNVNNLKTLDFIRRTIFGKREPVHGGGVDRCLTKTNSDIFSYTTRRFLQPMLDKQPLVSNVYSGGGSPVLPMAYFSPNKGSANYSAMQMGNSVNYSDVTTKRIRPELPMTFVGGRGGSRGVSMKDTNMMLEKRNLIAWIGKKNLKSFNKQFNENVNRYLTQLKASEKKVTQKSAKQAFMELTK
jgi:hypothetical protein